MNAITFDVNPRELPGAAIVLALLEQAGISQPIWSVDRMERALRGSSVVVCARHAGELVGFARAITDFAWCAYLSQLAVMPGFQRRGIGKSLVAHVVEAIGEEVSLVVHSAEPAKAFYASVGFEPYSDLFRFKRRR